MDLIAKFGPLLGQIAPSIATALGGPLAGVAVKTLSSALFGHEDASEDQISEAMASASPRPACRHQEDRRRLQGANEELGHRP